VCMSLCVYVCPCVPAFTCVYMCICVLIHLQILMCVYVFVCPCVSACVCVCVRERDCRMKVWARKYALERLVEMEIVMCVEV